MRLKQYLDQEHLSVLDFAKRIGCSPVAIYRYISADRIPRPVVMRAIAGATAGAVTANDFVEQHAAKPKRPEAP